MRFSYEIVLIYKENVSSFVKVSLLRVFHLSPFVLISFRCRRRAISRTRTNSQ